MKESTDIMKEITPIFNNPENYAKIEEYLYMNSNLPGPRGNLTLADKFAGFFKTASVRQELIDYLFLWANISEETAPVNDPIEYLPFCAILALGAHYYYAEDNTKLKIMEQLKKAMSDKRWRIREAVAMGFQYIAEMDFEPVRFYFTRWYTDSNYLEKRTFLAALAHPPILKDKDIVRFSLNMSDAILKELISSGDENRKTEEFSVLSKGLQYCLSVFAAELPEEGFQLLKNYADYKDKAINKIIKANLLKTRLTKKYPQRVKEILEVINE
ncbi:hypothetical protein [Anaerocolumna sp. MB42-C2]|uniref:hypothetical protein n=1 Tax=Anaerocolumna sp. MB42-C2 TaxID=3070997 RepID=UPI0027DF0C13|nr:hypothetical protein [Anaerocolumna sp. MB42-C2]WMJ87120.1 hypothetical protein RBU59_24275 [Anaerocolumna sp. MB42-C2]